MLHELKSLLNSGEMQSAPKPQQLQSEPINPAWIKEGNPEARASFLTTSPDARIRSGVWETTAGRFDWIFEFDEVVQILEGEVHVESGGETKILTAGSTAFFPLGLKTHWHVPKYVRKFFIHRYPGKLSQLARRVRAKLSR